jgi:hypothetical protein
VAGPVGDMLPLTCTPLPGEIIGKIIKKTKLKKKF